MKPTLALALALVLAACAAPDDTSEPTSQATQAISGCPTPGHDATVSEAWDVSRGAEDLWPSNCGITTTQVLIRKGPTNPITNAPTFLAFVVWNDDIVGHIFWVDIGNNGFDFHQTWDSTFGQRTNNSPDRLASGGGAPDGGNPPNPHPHVDGSFTVDIAQAYLDNKVKPAALSIDTSLAELAGIQQ